MYLINAPFRLVTNTSSEDKKKELVNRVLNIAVFLETEFFFFFVPLKSRIKHLTVILTAGHLLPTVYIAAF